MTRPTPLLIPQHAFSNDKPLGCEVLTSMPQSSGGPLDGLLAALEWAAGAGRDSLAAYRFVILRMPQGTSAQDAARIQAGAQEAGLEGRICLALDAQDTAWRAMADALGQRNLMVLLDEVGPQCPLQDLIHPHLNALRLQAALVGGLLGDLRLHAVVDAIAALARSIGLTLFVKGCPQGLLREQLGDSGVDYFPALTDDSDQEPVQRLGQSLELRVDAALPWCRALFASAANRDMAYLDTMRFALS